MKRIVRTALVGMATVGVAVGMAMPANAVLPGIQPGGCIEYDPLQIVCEAR